MRFATFATSLVVLALVGCGYDNSQLRLRTAVDAQRDSLNACYADTLASDPDAGGTMKILVRVAGNGGRGYVQDARVVATEVAGPELQRCVQTALVGLPIGAAPLHDDLNVEYTLAFQPQ